MNYKEIMKNYKAREQLWILSELFSYVLYTYIHDTHTHKHTAIQSFSTVQMGLLGRSFRAENLNKPFTDSQK